MDGLVKIRQGTLTDGRVIIFFLDDVKKAKALENFQDLDIEEINKTEHPKINWLVHSSGLTGIRFMEEEGFYNLYGIGVSRSAKIGIEILRVTLKDFHFFKAGYMDTWNKNKEEILMHIKPFLSEFD